MSNIPANPQNLAVVMARPLAAMYQAMPRLHKELPETPVFGMNDAELTVGDLRAADVIVNRDRMVYVAMRQANVHLLNFLALRIFTPRPMQKFRCICPNRPHDLDSLRGLNELVVFEIRDLRENLTSEKQKADFEYYRTFIRALRGHIVEFDE